MRRPVLGTAILALLVGLSGVAACASAPVAALRAAGPPSVSRSGAPRPVGSTTTTAPSTPARPAVNWSPIQAYLARQAGEGKLSGTVLIADGDDTFVRSYGSADRSEQSPNTDATMYRIGSVTKQFTATAIMLLQERGKLTVNALLCRYLPDCPPAWASITVGQLLTHTSGIPDYLTAPDVDSWWLTPQTPAQLFARFRDRPLDFPPGTVMRYSNSNYVLLGMLIERLSGESYQRFLDTRIFGPLGLHHTGYDTTAFRPGHAVGYYPNGQVPDPYDISSLYSAGGLYSTVDDLLAWDRSLLAHRLLSATDTDDMFAVHTPCPPSGQRGCQLATDQGYGYGWFSAAEPEGTLHYHVGHIDGFISLNAIYPGRDLDVIVLANDENTDVLGIGRTVAGMT